MNDKYATSEEHGHDNSPCYIFSVTDTGLISQMNAHMLSDLDYQKGEIIGKKKFVDLLTPGSRIFFQTHFFPLLKINGKGEEVFLTFRNSSAMEYPVLLNMSCDSNGAIHAAGLVISKRNIYDNALLEAKHAAEKALKENVELVQLRSRLERNQQLLESQLQNLTRINEENEEFNKLLSHDLQEPLRKIGLISSYLKEGIQNDLEDPEIREFLGKVSDLSSKARSLLVRLQKFHSLKLQNVKRELDLNSIFERALDHSDMQEMKPDLSSLAVSAVAGDPKYLELLFAELFRNSDKFRHPSRPLQISISSESITRNIYRATERKYKFGEFVRIAVSDNGIGFDDTHAELVLQLLQKLGQAEGDGLGLAFCKKIAELHGGEIGIRSQKGDGTVVLITLPV